jgi:hypothetical protein
LAAELLTPALQAFAPPQATVHELPEQLIEPAHAFESVHATSQPAEWSQVIPPAHASCPQVILQARREGQVIADAQLPAALQSIAHLSSV